MFRFFFSLLLLLPLFSYGQEITLNLGEGKKAYYKPPAGFKKGEVFDGEHTFSTPDSKFYIEIKAIWKRGRTAEKILEESLSGLKQECESKQHITEVSTTVWKVCKLKVGPRDEGRICMVIDFKDARNALSIGIHFRELNEAKIEEIRKTIDAIRVTAE